MTLFNRILRARGLDGEEADAFLNPNYDIRHDPFLLPDMEAAVTRLEIALKNDESITIYGDYDIDGLTASTLLVDAFASFGFKRVDVFIPNRFIEGYGMTVDAVDQIAATGTTLIVTVDCGSLSEKEIVHAASLGIDVIVTDHHAVAPVQPPAIAVINPKRTDHKYPFIDLAGVGVAFKLVQAMQTRMDGLPLGAEKWLLDLVALGTVCDVVQLVDENRVNVFWGLKVLQKQRRPGLKALMAIARVEPDDLNARSLGFALGPRMNAAGRLETAQYSLDMLLARDPMGALKKAEILDDMNRKRRLEQDKIFESAIVQAENFVSDPVLVVSGGGWNHGIVGIVAAKLLEKYAKPTFVLEEMGEQAKGSARSYGDFSAVEAIRASDDIIIKGGGHKLAAGVTLFSDQIDNFRQRVNQLYREKNLHDQRRYLLVDADVVIDNLVELNEDLLEKIGRLEPFGNGNPEIVLRLNEGLVRSKRTMGQDGQHVKIRVADSSGKAMDFLAFNAPHHYHVEPGERVNIWFNLTINDFRGIRSVECKIRRLELS
ncbi:MAG: single-stranded-DNA-specific exonuclease RecJ [Candidatus Saccharimonadaceae bacterium]